MLKVLVLISLCLAATALPTRPDSPEIHDSPDPPPVPNNDGIIINLKNGELCLFSVQCKSSCCHRPSGLSLARCAPRAAEREACSKSTLYGTYYICTCENGLKCEGSWSIGGSIANTNFGTCVDPNAPK
ncbi:colipase [Astyanax mexicanus]|uniref:colipase n=1 Tax=Astyanax mexicanus TaxID=7994 RepID=UPI0020CB45A6|nr:colipase [Astyanax mexicanus]XP_049341809.1 colipase [Astyanax mexicanus]